LELPSGIGNDYLLHVKKLKLKNISSLQAPHAFPHVTELTWYVYSHTPIQLAGLLDTLEQLPVLERVELIFQTGCNIMTDPAPHVVTLPHVQRMYLFRSDEKVGISHILGFLKLPNLTSLVVEAVPELRWPSPTLPVISFGEHLPNLAELPEMEVYTDDESDRVDFQSPSQAMLEYLVIARPLGENPYRHDRKLWGGLPLHSVRRLTAALYRRTKGPEDVWLVSLLRDLSSLEHLELEGFCGHTLRRLRQTVMRGDVLLGIKTLTVRSRAYEIRQALRLKGVADGLGLGIVVTCILDPSIRRR
jgi:hypothetical protein